MIEIKPKDLDKILLVMKYMMDERPDLNERLMDFYCYLQEMKSPNPTNLKRVTVDESDSVDMSLDEMRRMTDIVIERVYNEENLNRR